MESIYIIWWNSFSVLITLLQLSESAINHRVRRHMYAQACLFLQILRKCLFSAKTHKAFQKHFDSRVLTITVTSELEYLFYQNQLQPTMHLYLQQWSYYFHEKQLFRWQSHRFHCRKILLYLVCNPLPHRRTVNHHLLKNFYVNIHWSISGETV